MPHTTAAWGRGSTGDTSLLVTHWPVPSPLPDDTAPQEEAGDAKPHGSLTVSSDGPKQSESPGPRIGDRLFQAPRLRALQLRPASQSVPLGARGAEEACLPPPGSSEGSRSHDAGCVFPSGPPRLARLPSFPAPAEHFPKTRPCLSKPGPAQNTARAPQTPDEGMNRSGSERSLQAALG